jgi:acid phosphatase
VVIYEENHSFDNLYGGWEGVNGLSSADPAHTIQVNQAGNPYACLLQKDVNLASPPLPSTCTDVTTATTFTSAFGNNPFTIDQYIPASATTCPAPGVNASNGILNGQGLPGGCTRDLVHKYYQHLYQLDGGKADRYVTGSDAAGLTMGTYNTKGLPLYTYLHQPLHPWYAIADDFFQGGLGGSFFNHLFLVSATAPVFANALNDGSANDLHAVVDANGMPGNTPLYTSPSTAVLDLPLTASCNPPSNRGPTPPGVTCGDFAVNTVQPFYQPYQPGTAEARRLPPLTNATIGDELSAAGVDWAWYSGGWSNANGDVGGPGWTNGSSGQCNAKTVSGAVYPNCPDKLFQYHHQPFNYFAAYAPGTAARAQHLRDEVEFIGLAQSSTSSCGLKPVSFVKPIGEENEHPGYASTPVGSSHLVQLLQAVVGSACAKDTMVVVTYDEFGGQWDHVPPPGQGGTPGPHDQWGPGTRIPALVVAPFLQSEYVIDHTQHDTSSILATIEHRFGLAALTTRDAAVSDLSSVFEARPFVPNIFSPEMQDWLSSIVPGSFQYESLPPILRAFVDAHNAVATALRP